ncbi:hypothetical protein PMAYCL1PPCAC_13388, partial [Pristionchus mayeri]
FDHTTLLLAKRFAVKNTKRGSSYTQKICHGARAISWLQNDRSPDNSTAILGSAAQIGNTLANELGHNLGMHHD